MTYDKELEGGEIAQFDCGAIVNGLVLAEWFKGLGAVANSQGIMQSPVVHEHAGIPDDQVIMICVAMGYRDWVNYAKGGLNTRCAPSARNNPRESRR